MNVQRWSAFLALLGLLLASGPGSAIVRSALTAEAAPRPHAAPALSGEGRITTPSFAESGRIALPADVPADWWQSVQQQIRQSEYQVNWQEQTYLPDLPATYQAPNRAHNLRTYFTPEGVRIIPRNQSEPPWELGLALAGWQPSEDVLVEGHRVEYRYASASQQIDGWYRNDEQGLEQGFVISPPPGSLSPRPLVIEILGSLTPRLIDNAVEFVAPDGSTVLRYGDIRAVDAAGRPVPVQLELNATDEPSAGLLEPSVIHVSHSTSHLFSLTLSPSHPGSAFPLTLHARIISPSAARSTPAGLSISPNWTAEGNQVEARFGYAVGTAGDVNHDGYSDVVVGAPWYDNGQVDEGRAYVYMGSPSGLDSIPAWFTESGVISATFGWSVGSAGDVNGDGYSDVIVGAPFYANGQLGEGAAFVYHGSPGGLLTTCAWLTESNAINAKLGWAVGTAGDVNGDGYSDVVVGATGYSNGHVAEGRALVYYGTPGGPSTTPDWTFESDQDAAALGSGVGTAGDVNGDGYADLVVGAELFDSGQFDSGAAYAFPGSPDGLSSNPVWVSDGQGFPFAFFGTAVGTAGDVNGDGYSDIIVGAPGHGGYGSAYVYYGAPGGPGFGADWWIESAEAGSNLGAAVGSAGDVNGDGYSDIIVGAPNYFYLEPDAGQAFVYYGSVGGPSLSPDWEAWGEQPAQFGTAVGTAGDVNGDGYSDIIVGAPLYDNDQADEGAAFVYHGSAAGLSSTSGWTAESDQADAQFGCSADTAGDVNGDGYADVIVGARYYDNGQSQEGAAFVYHGSAAGLSPAPDWTAESDQDGAYFGTSVGAAGDVDGDGYSDVIVGADSYDNGEAFEGRAYVYHGSAAGLSPTPDWTAESDQINALFGSSVGTAGDVDGDGCSEVIVGAASFDNGQTDEGRAYVYHGSAAGLSSTPNWTAESDRDWAYFGCSVGTAGDVDGDGYSDVIVGAWNYGNGQSQEGAAFVYHGSAAGLSPAPNWTAESDQTTALFGQSVGTAGDVDGDGYADVVVGADNFDNGQTGEGAAFAYYGSAAGLSPTPNWTAESNQIDAHLGRAVSTAGDVDGDGYSDVIVGAPFYDNGEADEGRAYVYHGSAGGLSPTPDWTAEGNQPGHPSLGNFGCSAATAGDTNGDGYGDIVVGAYYYDNGQADEGAAFLYYGNGGNGLDLRPAQWRSDGSAPIAPEGISDSPTAVQLRLTGRMPLGRELVKLEWQVAPLGTSFTATGIVSGTSPTWTDTFVGGVGISETVTGLAPGMPYHWRVRLRYRPGSALGQAAGRWLTVPWNGWTEKDLRTTDGPITGLTAGNDSPTRLGNATYFTATADPVYVTYTWAFGDGTLAYGAILTHTYTATGSYLAIVTTSNTVDAVTFSTTVTVDESIAGLIAANDGPTALGSPTTLTATITTGSNVSYTWAFGDGNTGSGAVVTHTYAAIGTYTAVVTAGNSVSLVTASTVVDVEEPIAGLAAASDGPTVLGNPTTLSATIAAGSRVSYTWALGDGVLGSGPLLSHTYAAPGMYTAVVTAGNSVSLVTASTVVDVDEPIAGLAAASDGPTILGNPTTLTATITAGSRVSYTWAFGDGILGSGPLLSHTYAAPGMYTAVVTVGNSVSLVTASTIIDVDEAVAGLLLLNNSPTLPGQPTLFTVTTAAGSRVSFTWSFGDGSKAWAPQAAAVISHTYAAEGNYTAVVTASNSVSTLAASTTVTVGNQPPSADAGLDQNVHVDDLIVLDGSASSDPDGHLPLIYHWTQSGGPAVVLNSPTLSQTSFIAPSIPAVLSFTLAVTDALGLPAPIPDVVVITASDVPILNMDIAHSGLTMLGQLTHLTATVDAGSNLVCRWNFGDGSAVLTTGITASHSYAEAGIYTVVLTASNGTSWATATAIAVVATMAPVGPQQGGTLVYYDSHGTVTMVEIPTAAVTRTYMAVYTPLISPTQPLPEGWQFAHHAFALDFLPWHYIYLPCVHHHYTSGGGTHTATAALPWLPARPVQLPGGRTAAEVVFERPITITILYSDEDVAGLSDESSLHIVYWTGSGWEDVVGTCTPASIYTRDLDGNVLSVPICHLTEFGMIGD